MLGGHDEEGGTSETSLFHPVSDRNVPRKEETESLVLCLRVEDHQRRTLLCCRTSPLHLVRLQLRDTGRCHPQRPLGKGNFSRITGNPRWQSYVVLHTTGTSPGAPSDAL